MATNTKISNNGKIISMIRTYTANADLSATQYLPATEFKVGADQADITITDTDLTHPIPIADGTLLDDGDNTLTGSTGGDNSTDNTTTYKPGAGVTDNTSQNLIANGTSATKIWTIADLSSLGTNATGTELTGLWIYILDATALAKFLSAGTALEVKLGSDSSNYYSLTVTAANLAVGWNWIDMDQLDANTETGTVGSPIDTFIIEITTNNAADAFVAGDVLYDTLRQWVVADTTKTFVTGYPTFDTTNKEVTIRTYLTVLEAVGFNISGHSLINEDTSVLTQSLTKTDEAGKSDTDEFAYVVKDRWI